MADSIVIESRVKDFIKKQGGDDFRCAGEVIDNLQGAVEQLLKDAVRRAKENGRKTVQGQDI